MQVFATIFGKSVVGAALPQMALPMKLAAFALPFMGFLEGGNIEKSLATHVGLFSLTSAVMFIGSIRGLNKHSTAQQGNAMGVLATALGILSILATDSFSGMQLRFFTTFALAGVVGYGFASRVSMEDMPQLVASFHSFVGLAAVFAGFASYLNPGEEYLMLRALETIAGCAVGMLTFTGSVVAAGKLQGMIPGAPIILPNRWLLNGAGLTTSFVLSCAFCTSSIYNSGFGLVALSANTLIWAGLGINMVLPVGGADMPVIVSLLNAFSGLATSAAGFMLSNDLLTITGALVASSGALLSDIMCRGINRSLINVLIGGFGTDGGVMVASTATGTVKEVKSAGFVDMLVNAKRVIIVPGYGLAVARCQKRLADVVALLRNNGVIVHFAIHPVAGRLPGHMDVLLAEANVPYDIVRTMEDVNPELPQYDVAIVVGANDIVNPATQKDPSSPIYGMPAIEVWKAKICVVMKRSMATGYSGVENPLFYEDNVLMLFGDAKATMDSIYSTLEASQDRIKGGDIGNDDSFSRIRNNVEETFPDAVKVLGVIRERRPRECRVSVSPSVVPKLRRMGFSILLEAGAGSMAGFTDEDYLRAGGAGGVKIAESAVEVLKQADVVLKVNEPLLDEVQVLSGSQCMVGFWNMFGSTDLLEALKQSPAAFINLALIPRISRAQSLDALSSMANIAGYKAVLDAFNRFPRFSRASVTAGGAVPPARVFVIGAGVAGLSAIATANALGAKVFANDVRDAAREQVESMGAEFIPVDAIGIAGEGMGGYAGVMSDDFTRAQLATYQRVLPDMDIVITTAMIPFRAAPKLITDEMMRSMRRGSVIIDLAASTGGNTVITEVDKVVQTSYGVTVVGETNYPSLMAVQASDMYGNNLVALLDVLGQGANFGGEKWNDPVIRPATIVRNGELLWPPPPPAPAPPVEPHQAREPASFVPETQTPAEVDFLVKFISDHKDELAMGVGAAVVLGLGFTAQIPDAELTHIGYFVLSCLIGHFTVAGVTPALHTPLISVTNAISGIIVVGGMLQLQGPLLSARVGFALAAVFLSSVNIVGGFAVTQRMLELFREDKLKKVKAGASSSGH